MTKIFISNVYLNGEQSDILIEDNLIRDISPHCAKSANDALKNKSIIYIDGWNKAVIPSFANMHTHAAMTLFRGNHEDIKLKAWLKAIWKKEAKLNEELVYWGTKLACLEMIKSGTTLYNDQYFFLDGAQKASSSMGVRCWHSYVFLDLGNKKKGLLQRDECQLMYEKSKKWGELSNFAVTIHAPYSVREENIIWAKEFANSHNLHLHIHVAETGQERLDSLRKHKKSPVAYLDDLDFFSPKVIAAHCIWIDEHGIDILGSNKVNVVHNVNSNLKLSSGYKFKYQELIDAGANVCLGTDGCASSNNLDMMEAMKTSALVQKAWRKDPSAIPIKTLLSSASENGYKTFGLKGGKIKKGYLADLLLVDIDSYYFTPNTNFLANLVYSAHSDCVNTVICNGKILMKNRVVKGEKTIIKKVNELYTKLL